MSFWKQKNVLVTGATGLLGSWLVEDLMGRGAHVTCLVRDWIPRCRTVEQGLLDRANVVRGELEDQNLVLRAMNEHEIDTVFHLGAQTIVGTASVSARSTFDANIRGTWNVMEACRSCAKRIQRVVVASSDKAYGVHEKLPYTEETSLQGRYPYDVSKSCADLIALCYFHTYQTPVAITRCGNLFGGGDLNFNRLIPGTIRSALQNESPIIRSDGKFVRDYFYVKDAVTAYRTLAERMPDECAVGQAFNFGTETPMSVLDIVKQILELTGGAALKPTILNEASHEIREQYLDCAKARRTLNWTPSYMPDDALRETIEWYRTWLAQGCVQTPQQP